MSRLPPRLDPANWRAALWALRAVRHCRRELPVRGARFPPLPVAPRLPDRAGRGVVAVLARTRTTCLERAAVLQAWEMAHDRSRDVVIGVTKPGTGFRAHAWLDGDDACHAEKFTELVRLPPP